VRLHAYEWGEPERPPLVCMHGVSSHGLRFRRLAEQRLARRFRVVAVDLRGHGLSEWEPPWDLETHVGDLLDTADALGIDRAVWMGHSFGGRLAIELAARRPDRVERIVLLDPAVWVPPPVALDRAEAQRQDESFASPEEAIEVRIATGGDRFTPRAFFDEEIPEHLFRGADGRYRYRYARSVVVAAYGEMAKAPPLDIVHAPTLIVRGAESEVLPEMLVESTRELIAAPLEVVTVRGGHIPMWDAFDETADAIDAFLE
jgi:lipase